MGVTNDEKVTLCKNCRRKVRYLLRPIEKIIVVTIVPGGESEEIREEMQQQQKEDLATILEDKERTKQLNGKVNSILDTLKKQLDGAPIPIEMITKRAREENISPDFLEWSLLTLQKDNYIKRPKRFVIVNFSINQPSEEYVAVTKAQRDMMEKILDIIKDVEEAEGVAPVEVIISKAEEAKIEPDFTAKALKQLNFDGILFEPKPGYVKRVV